MNFFDCTHIFLDECKEICATFSTVMKEQCNWLGDRIDIKQLIEEGRLTYDGRIQRTLLRHYRTTEMDTVTLTLVADIIFYYEHAMRTLGNLLMTCKSNIETATSLEEVNNAITLVRLEMDQLAHCICTTIAIIIDDIRAADLNCYSYPF